MSYARARIWLSPPPGVSAAAFDPTHPFGSRLPYGDGILPAGTYSYGAVDDTASGSVIDEPDYLEDTSLFAIASRYFEGGGTPSFAWPILDPSYVRKNSFAAKLPSGKPHAALDMGAAGDVVRATAVGKVLLARDTKDARGKAVILDLGNGWEARHYHLNTFTVAKGDTVAQGQQIGVVGATGLPKNNPHLHFEIRRAGIAVDPIALLPPRDGIGPVASAGGIGWPLLIGGVALAYFALKG